MGSPEVIRDIERIINDDSYKGVSRNDLIDKIKFLEKMDYEDLKKLENMGIIIYSKQKNIDLLYTTSFRRNIEEIYNMIFLKKNNFGKWVKGIIIGVIILVLVSAFIWFVGFVFVLLFEIIIMKSSFKIALRKALLSWIYFILLIFGKILKSKNVN